MSGRQRDLAGELADRLEAAAALIESLEEEVASLRRDLEEANAAVQAARREVSARERRILELEHAVANPTPDPEARERIRDLEEQLHEAREESERRTAELEAATDRFSSLLEPSRRLNAGISLFNNSEHARVVAAISKSLGLPQAHAALDDSLPSKPVLTFVWAGMAWRRYVCEPDGETGDGEIYLSETGDDSSEIDPTFHPNAHVDARGRVWPGIRSR